MDPDLASALSEFFSDTAKLTFTDQLGHKLEMLESYRALKAEWELRKPAD